MSTDLKYLIYDPCRRTDRKMDFPESVHVIDAPYYDIGIRLGVIARNEVVVFDTGTGTTFEDAILPFMKRMNLKRIHKAINLHGHQDHIGSNAQLKENYGTEIMCHGSAAKYLEQVDAGLLAFFVRYFKYFPTETVEEIKKGYYAERGRASRPDRLLSDGDIVLVDGIELEMIAAPGHDATMLCVYDRSDKVLFSSDAIQGSGVTSKQFPSLPLYEDVSAYLESMHRLAKVEFEYLVPGHPFAPYTKQILNRREGLDLLDQSVKAVVRLEMIVRECLEETGKSLDLATVTVYVQKKMTGGSVTAQDLCTVSAHLQKLASEGRARLTRVGSEERYVAQ